MEPVTKMPVILYTESTPNPESLKFVANRLLLKEGVAEFKSMEEAQAWSPLAVALFEMPFVKNVYLSSNFVTVTKEFNYDWHDIMGETKTFIKDYLSSELPILAEGFAEHQKEQEDLSTAAIFDGPDGAIALRIKELIDTFVKPAVEGDGGNIEFKSFKDGVVYVLMQGSCSGCPSSTVTLKAGIEGMLQRMVPEVKEVVQEMA